jgi:DNA-directed RNA polymerase specialized sigma24 family protein
MGVLLVDPVSAAEVAGGGLLDAAPAAGDEEDLDVADVLVWAERTGVVDADEVALLVEMAALGRGAPREVAARRGVHERTVRKRRSRALAALRAARGRYLASLAA